MSILNFVSHCTSLKILFLLLTMKFNTTDRAGSMILQERKTIMITSTIIPAPTQDMEMVQGRQIRMFYAISFNIS